LRKERCLHPAPWGATVYSPKYTQPRADREQRRRLGFDDERRVPPPERAAPPSPRVPSLIPQKLFIKSFCKTQCPLKFVNLSFIITNKNNKVEDCVADSTFEEDFINTLCEMSVADREQRGRLGLDEERRVPRPPPPGKPNPHLVGKFRDWGSWFGVSGWGFEVWGFGFDEERRVPTP